MKLLFIHVCIGWSLSIGRNVMCCDFISQEIRILVNCYWPLNTILFYFQISKQPTLQFFSKKVKTKTISVNSWSFQTELLSLFSMMTCFIGFYMGLFWVMSYDSYRNFEQVSLFWYAWILGYFQEFDGVQLVYEFEMIIRLMLIASISIHFMPLAFPLLWFWYKLLVPWNCIPLASCKADLITVLRFWSLIPCNFLLFSEKMSSFADIYCQTHSVQFPWPNILNRKSDENSLLQKKV